MARRRRMRTVGYMAMGKFFGTQKKAVSYGKRETKDDFQVAKVKVTTLKNPVMVKR